MKTCRYLYIYLEIGVHGQIFRRSFENVAACDWPLSKVNEIRHENWTLRCAKEHSDWYQHYRKHA